MTPAQGLVAVWSWPLRVLHWALALAVVAALASHEAGRIHEWIGYGVLALAALRTLLGFIGRRSMRFAAFVPAPQVAMAYARDVLRGRERRHLNHNPLGGWMIVALLGCSVLAAASGALYVTDAFWGRRGWASCMKAAASCFICWCRCMWAGCCWLHGGTGRTWPRPCCMAASGRRRGTIKPDAAALHHLKSRLWVTSPCSSSVWSTNLRATRWRTSPWLCQVP